MMNDRAIHLLESMAVDHPQERYQEAINMAIEALKASTESTNTPTDLISRHDAIKAVGEWMQKEFGYLDFNKSERLIDAIEALPSRITEYKTFCGVPIEEAMRIVQEHKADPLCALADRTCPFQGKEFAWCLTCPHISEEDRELVRKVVEGSEPKTGKCETCKRNADNGGFYDDGRTKCPIQEHYALLKDGYCHLYEPRMRGEEE